MRNLKRCGYCREFLPAEELENGVCHCCIEENACKEAAIEVGDRDVERATIKINGFLNWYLGKDLEAVLISYLTQDESIHEELDNAAREYCLNDRYGFAEFLRGDK